MGLGGVAIAVLPSMIYPKQPFSDGLGGNFGLIYAEKIDFTPIYAKNYPLAYGFCCTFASEKIKRRCETLSSSFTYTRITMGFR